MCSLYHHLSVTKNHHFGQFDLWELLYRPPFTNEGHIWCAIAHPRYTLTCQNSSGSVYSVALWRRKTPIFAVFWTSAFSDVSWRQSEKVEHRCTTTNLPLSNGIKLYSVLQRLYLAKSCAQALTFRSVTNKQTETDKKTQRFWPPRRRVKPEPHQTWHGDRGPRARSCTSKTFGVCRTILAVGALKNSG